MLGFFSKKKIDLSDITKVLNRRHYEFLVSENGDIKIQGKYNNNGKTFSELVLVLNKNLVSFKDTRGNFITKIPQYVKKEDMYPYIKDILGLI